MLPVYLLGEGKGKRRRFACLNVIQGLDRGAAAGQSGMVFQFRKNLILVLTPGRYDALDFVDIAKRVAARAPDLSVHVIDGTRDSFELPADAWMAPTLTIGIGPRTKFRPPRGPHLFSRQIDKLRQAEAMERFGIASPHAARFEFGMDMPASIWGDFILLKPAHLGRTSHGDGIQLFRRERLAALRAADFAADAPIRQTPMLAQRFIDTGVHPAKYRVLTLMGDILYCQRAALKQPRPDLSAPDADLERAVVSTGGGERDYVASYDEDVLDLGRRTAEAFGIVPLLGIDVIRDAKTGDLHVLEVNAGGNVWHFSSPMWADRRRLLPQVAQAMHEQFGAFDAAAKALTAAARRLAR